jgi:hypothetical protein
MHRNTKIGCSFHHVRPIQEIMSYDCIYIGQPILIATLTRKSEVATQIKMKCPICGSPIGKMESISAQRAARNHNPLKSQFDDSRRLSSTLVLEIEKERKFARAAIHICKVCKNIQTFLVNEPDV